MIAMGFGAFLTLLVISLIATVVIHNGIRYRYLGGVDGFLGKWIFGWVGAWIASPVLGHWFSGVAIEGQYIIPAFLGAFSAAFLVTAGCKAMARISSGAEAPGMVTAHAEPIGQVAKETRAA